MAGESPNPELEGVEASPSSVSLTVGESQDISVTANYSEE